MTPPVAIPENDTEKAVYALGLMMSQTLAQFDLSPRELDLIKQAVTDSAAGKTAVELSEWQPKIGPLAQERRQHIAEKEKEKGKAYLAAMAKEAGATVLDGGIVLKHIVNGAGDSPAAADTVKVHYRGTLIDKTEFDSSYKRNEPAEFPLTGVIKCWTEGVQHIKVGGRALLGCPPELAYGDQGRPSIPGGATLIFEIELLEIKK